MQTDVLVVGAGWSGLTCARRLAAAGLAVRVLERSLRVGGRAASRSVGGVELDFGPVFVHGDDTAFLDDVRTASPYDWPTEVRGQGTPCQPEAFKATQRRWAVPSGLAGVARLWAAELDVIPGFSAESWSWGPEGVTVVSSDGREQTARHLVWALAAEQTRDLLGRLRGPVPREVASASALLNQVHSVPSLVVLAAYEDKAPDFDVWYPEHGPLLLVSNESAKRGFRSAGLVLQSRAAWAAERFEGDREAWASELLAAAASLIGDWAARPSAWQTHRWRFGRLAEHNRLAAPLLLRHDAGSMVAVTGDLFDRAGGLQGAWKAGRSAADRLLSLL